MTKSDYLERAAECEEIAELLISDEAREKILKIADRWRELAALRQGRDENVRRPNRAA